MSTLFGRPDTAGVLLLTFITSAVVGTQYADHRAERVEIQRVAQRDAALTAVEGQLIWVGRVVGHIDDKVVVDHGGWAPVAVRLARIKPVQECAAVDDNAVQYTRAIVAATPVGSSVAVVRSRERDGRFRTPKEHKGFLHPTDATGREANLHGTTLNEKLVLAGRAVPNPPPPAADAERRALVESLRASWSARDFSYWSRFLRAHERARQAETGPTGECVRRDRRVWLEAERQRAEERERDRRREREQRRRDRRAYDWEVGPDGRRGTLDDYTGPYPGGGGGGGGGGSFNVPGRLCPTRFC